MERKRFDGNVASVTGASSGIGRAVALHLAREGAALGLIDINADGLARTAAAIAEAGGQSQHQVADVRDFRATQRAFDVLAEQLGGLDFCVNAAGIMLFGHADEIPIEDWERVLAVNLSGTYYCCRAAFPHLRSRGGGAIVNIATVNAHVPGGRAGAYGASKAGVIALTKQLAVEWGQFGIRVNYVSPGFIRTPMTEVFFADETQVRARAGRIPLGRTGEPTDVAQAISLLLDPQSGYITGAELIIDGGLLCGLLTPPERLKRS